MLEDLADSHQNENHKIVHEAEERANITGAEDEEPGAPLAASPRDAPASPQVAAVPRRQRGSRRFRKGTPALPWTELSTSADPEGALTSFNTVCTIPLQDPVALILDIELPVLIGG